MVGEPVIIPPSMPEPVAWLGLPKTGLQIAGDELLWLGPEDEPAFVILLAAIEDVVIQVRPNPVSVAFVLFAIGLAAIGVFVSESTTLTAFLYVFALGFFLLASLCVVNRRLMIRVGGTTIPVFVMGDSKAHVLAFTASLQNASRTARRIAGTRVLPPGSSGTPIG
jgi:hypothetical protein